MDLNEFIPSDYEKRNVDLAEVVQAIDIGDPTQVSPIILSVGPCRTGTTVQLRVFGAQGVPSFDQPLKDRLRYLIQDEQPPLFYLPQNPEQTIFIKETLGPYTDQESGFNPIDLLLKAGYPREKLKVILNGRSPESTWASWEKYWDGVTSLELFKKACKTMADIEAIAKSQGVPVVHYLYEALQEMSPEEIMGKLFRALGLPFDPHLLSGWSQLPRMGEQGSNIYSTAPLPIYRRRGRGAYDRAMNSDTLSLPEIGSDIQNAQQQSRARIEAMDFLVGYYSFVRAFHCDFMD